MNVIVSNKNEGLLNSLEVDVIKSINGEFTAEEILGTFSNFFFNRMFLDITALKNYKDISNIQQLSMNIEMDKVILLLPNELMSNNSYLSKLISMGIYNFGNNKESLMYLYNNPNTYKDVAQYHQINEEQINNKEEHQKKQESAKITVKEAKVIGFKNLTTGAGATTLIYMIKKTMKNIGYTVAIEVDKNDFGFFNEKDMYSVNNTNLQAAINRFGNANLILLDLNTANYEACDDIIYLIEPSIIKLNKMIKIKKNIFDDIFNKKIILNKSLLTEKDVKDFEFESHSKVSFNMPPVNDRNDNTEIIQSLIKELDITPKIN